MMLHILYLGLAAILLSWISLVSANECPADCQCVELGLVSCKNLVAFPEPTEIPHGTSEIILQSCDLGIIESVPDYGPSIRNLFVINSNIRQIADHAFSNLTQLRVLYLNSNKLKTLTKDTFSGLDQLEELNLGSNLIERLANRFLDNLPSLTQLDLNNNKNISFDVKAFEDSPLQQLSVEHCGLNTSKTSVFKQATALTSLDLDHNSLNKLPPGVLEGLTDLQQLYLADCNITEVDARAFDGLVKLETLDLSFNRLEGLHEDVVHDIHHTLQTLLLQHNNLTGLSYKFNTYHHLGLEGNPWHCDCSLNWMKDIEFQSGENVTCAMPNEVKGQQVYNVTSSQHCRCGYEGCQGKARVALYIFIPVLIVCSLLIGYYLFKILRNRKLKAQRTSIRYRSVYKDTVETSGDNVPLKT